MVRFLRRLKWLLKWGWKTRSWFWTKAFLQYHVPPIYPVFTNKKKELLISNTNFILPPKEGIRHLIEAFDDLSTFALSGARFIVHAPWDQIELAGLRFNIYSPQSIRILSEVFLQGIYEVSLPARPVVIDIGMNVGISSISLAGTLGCPVYGYEPFKDTFRKATENININPDFSDRIHAFQYAVGGTNRKEEFEFCPDSPGDCGIVPIPEIYRRGRRSYKETVEVISAADVVDFVSREEPDRCVVLKLDCEGMEYEIFDCLCKTGAISKVGVIMAEWHRRGDFGSPSALRDTLRKCGFVTFGNPHRASEVGMLYAVNDNMKCSEKHFEKTSA
ncbi:MAG TPA: FkbM family methyltransferase [Dissulfurispiraceae bacterium]|nr:FkbM family methyltransferase [Dissulfurispiraceae bacterium]